MYRMNSPNPGKDKKVMGFSDGLLSRLRLGVLWVKLDFDPPAGLVLVLESIYIVEMKS